MTVGPLCPSHADTAVNVQAALQPVEGAAVAEVVASGPLTPVPTATATKPTAAIPCVIHLN